MARRALPGRYPCSNGYDRPVAGSTGWTNECHPATEAIEARGKIRCYRFVTQLRLVRVERFVLHQVQGPAVVGRVRVVGRRHHEEDDLELCARRRVLEADVSGDSLGERPRYASLRVAADDMPAVGQVGLLLAVQLDREEGAVRGQDEDEVEILGDDGAVDPRV